MSLSARAARLGLVAAAALAVGAGEARALAVRVRWAPSAEASGYRLHVRPLPGEWAPPTDVGAPVPGPDGNVEFVLGGLAADGSWGFAVTAYDAAGAESGLSNEIQIGPGGGPPACGDACAPRARCALATRRFRWRRVGERWRLSARAAYPAPTTGADDLAVAVTADAVPVLAATIPGASARRRGGGAIRYRGAGVRRLLLRPRRDATEVRLAAFVPADAMPGGPATVGWTLQTGGGCAGAADLACAARRRGVVACE